MELHELVSGALKEDLPSGDITTESLGLPDKEGSVQLLAKEDIILSGSDLFQETFRQVDSNIKIGWLFKNGELILKNQIVATLDGNLQNILKGERVALNFLGKMSGIATYTRCFVERLKGSSIKVLDTRKTTPLYRSFEKQAVEDGGGQNHRMSLSDAILIKENHIRAVGSFSKAIERVKEATDKPIEVETTNLEEVKEAVRLNVDRIMLDNMENKEMKEAIELIPKGIEIEASGNMTLDRMDGIKDLGLNFVSVGAITHSAPCADFSLIFDWTE